jgi:Family of unknown function (DUF5662)
LMQKVIMDLVRRACVHDRSKLLSPELEGFDKSPPLGGIAYPSPEYDKSCEDLKPTLDLHRSMNDHHPEFFGSGIHGMNLIQLLELVCDWKSSSERMKGGSVLRSIESNQQRFGYSDETKKFLINTAIFLQDQPTGG